MTGGPWADLEAAYPAAQAAADSQGKRVILVQWLPTDGGDGCWYLEAWRVDDALFYAGQKNVLVIVPAAMVTP